MILATGQKKDYGRRLIPSLLWPLYTENSSVGRNMSRQGKDRTKM